MYIDIISYELAEGVSEKEMLTVTEVINKEWQESSVKGFIGWKICRNEEGNYYDVVLWQDRQSALDAEKIMMNLPSVQKWIACYKEGTMKTNRLTQIDNFPKI